ncbi:MAG: hypothetical protein MZU97_01585 [Bacillus subtilis]|nr:hypothetical protein [Bacillus subtilis]
MFGDVVHGHRPKSDFEHDLSSDVKNEKRRQARHRADRRGPARSSSASSRRSIKRTQGQDFPQDPMEQLLGRRQRRLPQLEQRRAPITYRQLERHPRRPGAPPSTSRRMVFGNMGDDSAPAWPSPATPRPARTMFYGEFLINAQGEDVVAGIRTPQPIAELEQARCPKVYDAARRDPRASSRSTTSDMQDIEFTDRGRQALHAPDPQRQAHRARRASRSPSTWSNERLHHQRGGRAARRARRSSTSCCIRMFDPKAARASRRSLAKGLPRLARRRHAARSSSPPTTPTNVGQAGREGHPRPPRDQPRRHPRHGRRRRASSPHAAA